MTDATEIVKKALSLGYENCGIISVLSMKDYAEKLKERIDRFPEIRQHAEEFYGFANIEENYPWAKSIIICSSWYGKYKVPDNVNGHIGKYYLTDSRRDVNSNEYQGSVKFETYLKEQGYRVQTNREFGITGLRWAAIKAGIGIVRKNNFYYTDKGSWSNLEAFLIDEDLEYINKNNIKPCPDKCNLCIKACPTGSLAEPYMMNRNTCISCLTTWEGWDLTKSEYSDKIGQWIYGCDVCQDVCPFNRNSWTSDEDFPFLDDLCKHLTLKEIVESDYEFLENVLQTKFWYIPKDKVWRFKTNALNAMLNNFKADYFESIKKATKDINPNVRKMAEWVLMNLKI